MAEDKMKGKAYEGTFAGGQGPILGQKSTSEPEFAGTHGGEGKDKVRKVNEGGVDVRPSGEDKHFDLHGSSYTGPENMVPEDKGDVTPGK